MPLARRVRLAIALHPCQDVETRSSRTMRGDVAVQVGCPVPILRGTIVCNRHVCPRIILAWLTRVAAIQTGMRVP